MRKANDIVHKLYPEDARLSLSMASANPPERVTMMYFWKAIWHSPLDRKRFLLSLGVAVGQSITAASALLYYSHSILVAGGVTKVLEAEAGIASAKFVGVAIALAAVDRIGRKALLVGGSCVMVLCHAFFAFAFYGPETELSPSMQCLTVAALHVFIFAWNVRCVAFKSL